jgi:hypothetical protein
MSIEPTPEKRMSPEEIEDSVKRHIWQFLSPKCEHDEEAKKAYIKQVTPAKVASDFLADERWSGGLAVQAKNLQYLTQVVQKLSEKGLKP